MYFLIMMLVPMNCPADRSCLLSLAKTVGSLGHLIRLYIFQGVSGLINFIAPIKPLTENGLTLFSPMAILFIRYLSVKSQ